MTHRYTAAADGWISFATPERVLCVDGALADAVVERLWEAVRGSGGAPAVLEVLTEQGLFATPGFAYVERRGQGAQVLVRGGAVVHAAGERIAGAEATTWIERSVAAPDAVVELVAGGALLPLESGVVRAGEVRFGDARAAEAAAVESASAAAPAAPDAEPPVIAEPPAATTAAVVEPEPEPAVQPEDDTIVEATFIADHDDEQTDQAAEEPVVETIAPAPAPAPAGAAGGADDAGDGYDYLFGDTVFHTVREAAVHDEEGDDEEAAASAEPAESDIDASTVVMTNRRGRTRSASAAPAAPEVPQPVLVLPDGSREALAQAIIVGRSPSVSGVPAGQLPRLITVSSPEQDISRSHVRIALEGGTVVVTDLHSRNGTVVTAPSGESHKLRAGEPTPVIADTSIDLGGVVLRIEEP